MMNEICFLLTFRTERITNFYEMNVLHQKMFPILRQGKGKTRQYVSLIQRSWMNIEHAHLNQGYNLIIIV